MKMFNLIVAAILVSFFGYHLINALNEPAAGPQRQTTQSVTRTTSAPQATHAPISREEKALVTFKDFKKSQEGEMQKQADALKSDDPDVVTNAVR